MSRGDIGIVAESECRADRAIRVRAIDIRQQLERQRPLVDDCIVLGLLGDDFEGALAQGALQLRRHTAVGGKRRQPKQISRQHRSGS